MTRIISIASGKGGVGKTNLSVNLGLHLAQIGFHPCLFDADLGLANVNILLGIRPEYDLEDVLFKDRSLEDIIVTTDEGLDIIPGSSGVERMANLQPEKARSLVNAFSRLDKYDFFLLDTASGASANVVAFCLASPEIILMITPEVTSLTDAYALLKILVANGFAGTALIVVSQCPDVPTARRTYEGFRATVKTFLPVTVQPLGVLLRDPTVEKAIRRQQSFVTLFPECLASKCVRQIAKSLLKSPKVTSGPQDMQAFWEAYMEHLAGTLALTLGGDKTKEGEAKKAPPAPESGGPEHGPEPVAHAEVQAPPEPPHDTAPAQRPAEAAPAEAQRSSLLQSLQHVTLPSPPEILVRVLELSGDARTAHHDLYEWIAKDPSLAAKALAMVHTERGSKSWQSRFDLKAAVYSLGRSTLKTMALRATDWVISRSDEEPLLAALQQLWQHSLTCAYLAEGLARETSYVAPHEAFVSGLLHDLGKFALLTVDAEALGPFAGVAETDEDPFSEVERRLGVAHAEIGASLLGRWGISSFVTDAVRYHHEPLERILHALPLVQLIYAANALCSRQGKEAEAAIEKAETFLSLSRTSLEKLISTARDLTGEAMASIGIKPSQAGTKAKVPKALFGAVREASLLQAVLQDLMEADGQEAVLDIVRRACNLLFNTDRVLFFLLDDEQERLVGRDETGIVNELTLPYRQEGSAVIRALRETRPLDTLSEPEPSILDRQLAGFLGRDGVLCVPMISRGAPIGVVVIGLDTTEHLTMAGRAAVLDALFAQAALALAADASRRTETNRLKNIIDRIKAIVVKGPEA